MTGFAALAVLCGAVLLTVSVTMSGHVDVWVALVWAWVAVAWSGIAYFWQRMYREQP